jgi:SAM-dependent methyltransferase
MTGPLRRLLGAPPEEPRKFWSARAGREGTLSVLWGNPSYNERAGRDQWAAIERHLPARRDDVLDLGCGTGRLAPALAAEFARYTGVDLPAMVEEARRRVPDRLVRFIASGVQEYAPAPESFDLVLDMACLASAVTAEEFPAVAARLAAAVRPGGRIILVDAFHRRWPLVRVCRMASPEVQATLHAHGLRTVAWTGIHFFPVRLLVARPAFASWPRLTGALHGAGELLLRAAPRLTGDYQVLVLEKPEKPCTSA